jgi:Ca2+/Na+ antiporter
VKYDALARAKKTEMRNELKLILLSFISFIAVITFFKLELLQIVSVVVLLLTLLYTLPFRTRRMLIGLE